jgi:hypothetical protein
MRTFFTKPATAGTRLLKAALHGLHLLLGIVSLVATSSVSLAATGGPDAFGYTFDDSNAPQGPAYDWVEISGTGTQVLYSSDDYVVSNIPLGFFFNYYGTDYTNVSISNNGLVFSGSASGQWRNEPIGQSSIHGFIAPFWDDLVTWGGGSIYYKTLGVSPNRYLVVEWLNNQHYYTSASGVTFQAILKEGSNEIVFQYQDVDFGAGSEYANNGGSATVGIDSPSPGLGLQYSFNQPVLAPGLAIRFKFPQIQGVNMFVSSQAPPTKDRGSNMNLDVHYNNFGHDLGHDVVLATTLQDGLEFVSSSGGGVYDAGTRTITWNIGSVSPGGHGEESVVVLIRNDVAVGTLLTSQSTILTTDLEVRLDDNTSKTLTQVTGPSLPPNTAVEPNNGGSTPSVFWGAPVTFSYTSVCATGVDITIHVNDGGPDITGPMVGGPPNWTYTTTFYPRHGQTTVTYTLHGCGGSDQNVIFDIYIDPAGYIFDQETGARISGASVYLQIPDGAGGWRNAPTGLSPAISQPDVNPLVTGTDGQYHWDVLAGLYRVHVQAPGYYPADSIVVNIPPPVTDLHVGLVRMPVIRATSYTLVSSRRITRTIWEYSYRLNLRNSGMGNASAVSANLRTYPANVTVVDGTATLPTLSAGSTVSSSDTFTIRIDRSIPVRNSDISWQVIFTDSVGTSRTIANLPLF